MPETNISTLKTCADCKVEQAAVNYHRDKPRVDGLSPYCKSCTKTRASAQYFQNREKRRAERKTDYEKNKETYKARARKWALENKEKRREISKKYVKRNPETRYATQTANRLANPGLYAAHYKARQTRKQRAMPVWANTDKISRIYKACAAVTRVTGVMHHVDHFYPLKSDFVCGLHNEFNLRIITASDNLSKSNSLPN